MDDLREELARMRRAEKAALIHEKEAWRICNEMRTELSKQRDAALDQVKDLEFKLELAAIMYERDVPRLEKKEFVADAAIAWVKSLFATDPMQTSMLRLALVKCVQAYLSDEEA